MLYNKSMRRILDEILWSIYYQTGDKIGPASDGRFFLLNAVLKDVHDFTDKQLISAVCDLKKQKFIEEKLGYEKSVIVSLTEKGILRAINYKFRRLNDKKEKWDGKWRMVAFDIPNSHRKGRKALNYRLKMGGFYELQESVFLYPYECKKEIDAFVKLFKLEKYVRFGLLDFIDNQDRIKIIFKIN
jgi:DNA-binding transcriptional regulator PaaX